MLFLTLFSEMLASRSTTNLLTVTADRIAKVLKSSGGNQAVVLDIAIKDFYKGFFSSLQI